MAARAGSRCFKQYRAGSWRNPDADNHSETLFGDPQSFQPGSALVASDFSSQASGRIARHHRNVPDEREIADVGGVDYEPKPQQVIAQERRFGWLKENKICDAPLPDASNTSSETSDANTCSSDCSISSGLWCIARFLYLAFFVLYFNGEVQSCSSIVSRAVERRSGGRPSQARDRSRRRLSGFRLILISFARCPAQTRCGRLARIAP
jgi:hypothetical protein